MTVVCRARKVCQSYRHISLRVRCSSRARRLPKNYFYQKSNIIDLVPRSSGPKKFRIAYLIKDDETIDILGVFHGALNLEKYLPKE